MIRWRNFFILALLLLLPDKTGCEDDDPDDDNDNDNGEDDENEDDPEPAAAGRRAPAMIPATFATAAATRTLPRRPLECYVCSYKAESYLRSCLDPTKFRVHTMACHSVDEKCFTTVTSKGGNYESVMRGCRSSCVGTPETTCCSADRCNSQTFGVPVIAPKVQMMASSKSNKPIPPSVLFFVTILLVLQTVVKVAV